MLPDLTADRFLAACTPSISGVSSLLEGLGEREIYRILELALGDELLGHEIVKRLVRDSQEQRP